MAKFELDFPDEDLPFSLKKLDVINILIAFIVSYQWLVNASIHAEEGLCSLTQAFLNSGTTGSGSQRKIRCAPQFCDFMREGQESSKFYKIRDTPWSFMLQGICWLIRNSEQRHKHVNQRRWIRMRTECWHRSEIKASRLAYQRWISNEHKHWIRITAEEAGISDTTGIFCQAPMLKQRFWM